MNKNLKYSSIFILFTVLLIIASSLVAATNIEDTASTDITENILTNTVSDESLSSLQTDNNIESQTIVKEVGTRNDHNTYDTETTSENNKIVEKDKNLKNSIKEGTVEATPNSGKAGDTINLHIYASGTALSSTNRVFDITAKLNDTIFFTGTGTPNPARNGYIDVVVPAFEPGTYTLFMEWNYNDGLRGASGTTPFTIIRTTYDTKINEVDTVNGEAGNVVIPITVTDVNNNVISGTSTITVKDDDNNVLIENYPIENGVTSLSVPAVKTGDYELTVEFAGNDDYNPCSATIPVSVSTAATTLIVDQNDEGVIYEIINAYENTILTGTLLQTSNNKGLANIPLKVTAGNGIYTITTDEEGKYEFKYNVTEIVEDVPITICFEGNDLYTASEVFEGSFDTEVLEVNIALDEVTLSEVNETTTITGSITDNYDNTIPNVEVELQINGEEPVTVTTDSKGKFKYDTEFKQAMTVTVDASMKNQDIYEYDSATTTFNVVVGPKRTNLTLETGRGTGNTIDIVDVTPYFNEVITNGTLIDIFGEPVENAKITILLNGEDYSQTTDNNGKFSLVYNATQGLTTYTLSVQFEGNDAYKPAGEVYTGTFTTEAFDITVTIDDNLPEEILNGDTITITGSATLQNETLKNNQIVLTIDERKYRTTTDEEGKFTYDYTVARTGNIPVIANATFTNADVKVAQKTITVAYPVVNIDLDEVSDTTVLTDIILNGRVYIAQNNTAIEDNLILKINEKTIQITSNEEGYFSYKFTPDTIGNYEISIVYKTNRYNVQNASTTVNVAKRQTQLVNNKLPIAVKVNDIFTISGTLMDQTNTAVTDAEVIFIINNEKFTNTTDENGHYEYNYQTTTVADNNLYEVRYSGDEKYLLAKNYVGSYFDIERTIIDAKITVEAENTKINVPTNITGTLIDTNNNPQSNIDIKIQINTEEFTTTTNDEGTYTLQYTPKKIGKHTVTATINNENYKQKTAKTEFEANKEQTTTTINTIKVSPTLEANITATVVDSNNNPINTGKVVFKINGKTIKDENGKVVYTKVTNGEATLPYLFTETEINQNTTVSATYSGTTNYALSSSKKVNIAKEDNHSVTMTMEDITATQTQTITITATLKDYNENINTGKVVFKINGKTIKDTNGKVIYAQVQNATASAEYTIPTTTKTKEYTLTAIYIDSFYNRTETTAKLTITENQNNTNISNINTTANLKTENGNVIIITNDNIDQYITDNGLTDLVNPGDTLDIQGTIDQQHSLVINKPVNVISSTKDAVISLHTHAASYFGENPGNCFVVNNAGSGSNISNLYLYNTECWMYNNYDVTLYNMTMYVKEARVGSGVGQTAIRYCERMIIDSCYIYTEANEGSTSVALTGSSDVLIINTTIEGRYGINQVGNILYLANPYNTGDKPSDFIIRNTNITMINSTIKGECIGAITEGVRNFASNCTFINNTINTTGNYGFLDTGIGGNAYGNKFYNEGRLIVKANCNASGNVFYGTGNLTAGTNANIYNNVITNLIYNKYANYTNNTIYNVKMYEGMIFANQTILGNIYVDYKTEYQSVNNVIIANNTIGGDVILSGGGGTNRISNAIITNNTIGGNINITQAQRNNITNNTINGSITNGANAFYTLIDNNIVVNDNEYAVTSVQTATITNNYLISSNYQKLGNDAILDSSGKSVMTNNGPEISEFWIVAIDPVYATIGDNTLILVNIVDEISGTPIEEGEVYLMINDDIVYDEEGNILKASVSSSQALFEINSIPREWLRSDAVLTAVFTSGTLIKTNSTYMTILKREANVEITTEELTITPGQTITLTTAVTDLETGEDLSGQLAFKINGLSLEDNDGKLICVDVVDGIAILEYTFGDDVAPGTYTLSAVFENTYYVRSTDDKDLVIE